MLLLELLRCDHALVEKLKSLETTVEEGCQLLGELESNGAIVDLTNAEDENDIAPPAPTEAEVTPPTAATSLEKPLWKVNVKDQTVKVDRQTFVVKNVPNKIKLVHSKDLTSLEMQALKCSLIEKAVNAIRCNKGNPLAD